MQDRHDSARLTRSVARRRTAASLGTCLLGAAVIAGGLGIVGVGCLTRDVQTLNPTLKTNFTARIKQAAVDKVDLLFAIDNSASMGDKQVLLSQAVPDLVNRLVTPFCVDDAGVVLRGADNRPVLSDVTGNCPGGLGKPEFPPVHDMHIGIVTSSLGGRGSSTCAPEQNKADPRLDAHKDDKAHLITRSGADEVPAADAPSAFLAWFPTAGNPPLNQGKSPPPVPINDGARLSRSFSDMVVGVHEHGCGYEHQLESVYRFLMQPDPYDRIEVETDGAGVRRAKYVGVDTVLLKQRAEFLRPDSLLAVIMITDENDSGIDPMSIGRQGYTFLDPSRRYRGTKVCETDPLNPACTSCGFKGAKPELPNDPNCTSNNGTGLYTDIDDDPNVRLFDMKRRFGLDPQYKIGRYVTGFRGAKVPDRRSERHDASNGEYVVDAASNTCDNPIFAKAPLPNGNGITGDDPATLDKLCRPGRGPRQPDSVFFALIGGVPWQFLLKNPDPNGAPLSELELKDALTPNDWARIVGSDPTKYDLTGIDPHMRESIDPRGEIVSASFGPTDTRNGGAGGDPVHGREWVPTARDDLQYACTFKLPAEKDCTRPEYTEACDCSEDRIAKGDIPLCNAATTGAAAGKKVIQARGKAYPTIRQLEVVKELGDQGIVASICPIRDLTTEADKDNPLYGYRPAVKSIVDRLKNALASQCLPQKLTRDSDGTVRCLVLETLATDGDQSQCSLPENKQLGLSNPEPQIVSKFKEQQRAEAQAIGTDDLSTRPVCQLVQLTVNAGSSCAEDGVDAGWCYVENTASGKPAGSNCDQAIKFTKLGQPSEGRQVFLQCIKAEVPDSGASVNSP